MTITNGAGDKILMSPAMEIAYFPDELAHGRVVEDETSWKLVKFQLRRWYTYLIVSVLCLFLNWQRDGSLLFGCIYTFFAIFCCVEPALQSFNWAIGAGRTYLVIDRVGGSLTLTPTGHHSICIPLAEIQQVIVMPVEIHDFDVTYTNAIAVRVLASSDCHVLLTGGKTALKRFARVINRFRGANEDDYSTSWRDERLVVERGSHSA